MTIKLSLVFEELRKSSAQGQLSSVGATELLYSYAVMYVHLHHFTFVQTTSCAMATNAEDPLPFPQNTL